MSLKITLKASERRHLTTSYLPEVTVQNHVLDHGNIIYVLLYFHAWTVFPRIYTNLQSGQTICNFSNSRPIYVDLYYEKWEIITEILDSWKFQNVGIFYFWKSSPKNGQNFQLFTLYSKGRHFSITKLDILIFSDILHLEMDFWNLSWKRVVSS